MKKILFLIIILCPLVVIGQESTIGFRLGLNVSKYKLVKGDLDGLQLETIPSINFSIPINIPISDIISVQPELSIMQKGSNYEYYDDDYSYIITQKITYFDIPILMKASKLLVDKLTVGLFLGPSIGLGLAGKVKDEENDDGDISKNEKKIDFKKDNANRIDLAFNIGSNVQYELKNGFAVFDIRYQAGFSDVIKEKVGDISTLKNRGLIVSVGYIMPLKR